MAAIAFASTVAAAVEKVGQDQAGEEQRNGLEHVVVGGNVLRIERYRKRCLRNKETVLLVGTDVGFGELCTVRTGAELR